MTSTERAGFAERDRIEIAFQMKRADLIETWMIIPQFGDAGLVQITNPFALPIEAQVLIATQRHLPVPSDVKLAPDVAASWTIPVMHRRSRRNQIVELDPVSDR